MELQLMTNKNSQGNFIAEHICGQFLWRKQIYNELKNITQVCMYAHHAVLPLKFPGLTAKCIVDLICIKQWAKIQHTKQNERETSIDLSMSTNLECSSSCQLMDVGAKTFTSNLKRVLHIYCNGAVENYQRHIKRSLAVDARLLNTGFGTRSLEN